jgi:hypothetical protein
MVSQLKYSVARRSRGRVAPCAVYTVHVEMRSADFLVEPQNQGRRFVSGLASKSLERFLPVWPQNWWQRFLAVWPQNLLRWFSPVWPQNRWRQFSLVWLQNQWRRFSPVWPQNWWRRFLPVWPQNQGGGGFPSLGHKTGSSGLVIWASKSPRWFLGLGLKIKWASVCRLRHKTDRGRSAQDMCRDLVACFAWKQVWLGFPSLA